MGSFNAQRRRDKDIQRMPSKDLSKLREDRRKSKFRGLDEKDPDIDGDMDMKKEAGLRRMNIVVARSLVRIARMLIAYDMYEKKYELIDGGSKMVVSFKWNHKNGKFQDYMDAYEAAAEQTQDIVSKLKGIGVERCSGNGSSTGFELTKKKGNDSIDSMILYFDVSGADMDEVRKILDGKDFKEGK